MAEVAIAQDFSRFPGGRYRTDGPNSGEEFRERFLVPALARGEQIVLVIDGTSGYPSSFLEEAFGGLVRVNGHRAAELKKHLQIKAHDPSFMPYRSLIWQYIRDAERVTGARMA